MKLSQWAKLKGISYITAYRLAKAGKIDGTEILKSGTIIINEIINSKTIVNNVVYARVSSNSRRN